MSENKQLPKGDALSLPKGWKVKILGEVCEIFNGLWKGKKPPFIEVGVIRNTNFTKDGFLDDSDIAFLPVEVKQFVKRKLQYGDIILEKSGGGPKQPVGRVIPFDKKIGEFSFSNFTSVIRVKDSSQLNFIFLHRFLFWVYVSGIAETMQRRSTGIRNLQLKEYKEIPIPIPIPPLPEQQRIVKILDKAFVAIDKAKQNAEQNLKNAKEVFESYLQNVFENKGEDWEEKSLREIVVPRCTLSYGIVQPGAEFENGLPVIRPVDLKKKVVKKTKLKLIDPKISEAYSRTLLLGDELLICVRGNTGVISLLTTDLAGANVTRGIVPVCFETSKLSLDFGYFLCLSPFVQKQIKDKTYGAALMQINIRDVRKLKMLIPPIQEQQKIVKKLNKLQKQTKKLESIYQQKLSNLEELKKSILQG